MRLLGWFRQNLVGGPPEGEAPVPEWAQPSAEDAPKESEAVAKHNPFLKTRKVGAPIVGCTALEAPRINKEVMSEQHR